MNKNTFTTAKLTKGEINVYDFGVIKLHAYKTNDFIDDRERLCNIVVPPNHKTI